MNIQTMTLIYFFKVLSFSINAFVHSDKPVFENLLASDCQWFDPKAVSISLSSLNRILLNCFFTFGNKKKSQGLKSREYDGFWYCSTWFSRKSSLVIQARWDFTLSSWKMRLRRPRISLRSDMTCHKHVLTYQLAFTVPPVSNGTDLIKLDFMKKTVIILFPGTFVSMDFAWTLISCRQANSSLFF